MYSTIRAIRSSRVLTRPIPPINVIRSFSVQSAATATRPAERLGNKTHQTQQSEYVPFTPLPPQILKRMKTAEQDLNEYHALQRRNAALGITLALFVGSIWAYSVHAVTAAKDSFTTPEVQEIQAELEREDKQAATAAPAAKK